MSRRISKVEFRHGLSEHPRGGFCHMVGVTVFPVEGEPVETAVTFDHLPTSDARTVANVFRGIADAIDKWDAGA